MTRETTAEADDDAFSAERLREGDRAAWDAFYRRWEKPLRAYLYRLGGGADEADELAADAFVRAWKARDAITGGKVSTWLFTIATNLHRNRRRWWARRLKWLVGMEDDFPEAKDPGPAPDDAALRDETAARVRAAVFALPPELREPLVLTKYEEMSHAEAAAVLGLTVKAVEHRVARARESLRATLSREA